MLGSEASDGGQAKRQQRADLSDENGRTSLLGFKELFNFSSGCRSGLRAFNAIVSDMSRRVEISRRVSGRKRAVHDGGKLPSQIPAA